MDGVCVTCACWWGDRGGVVCGVWACMAGMAGWRELAFPVLFVPSDFRRGDYDGLILLRLVAFIVGHRPLVALIHFCEVEKEGICNIA